MFAAVSVRIREVCPFGKLRECLPGVHGEEFGVGLQAKQRFLDSEETDCIHEPRQIISSLQLRSFMYLFYRKLVYTCVHSLSLSLV